MRKLFSFTLIYWAILNVIGPLIYYLFRMKFVQIYDFPFEVLPYKYMLLCAIIIMLPIIVVLYIVNKTHFIVGEDNIPILHLNNVRIWIILLIGIQIIELIRTGGYAGAIAGTGSSGFGGYVAYFTRVIFIVFLFLILSDKKKGIFIIISLYILSTILSASRSGILNVVMLILAALFCTQKYEKAKVPLVILILLLSIVAPAVFIYTTGIRGQALSRGIESVDFIVGRCSSLELGGAALYEKNIGIWNKNAFFLKYGMIHQIGLMINATFPGDVFSYDVDPNQYYRTVFWGNSYKDSMLHYSSTNMTLPIYLSIKYTVIFGIILSIVILLLVYQFAVILTRRHHYLLGTVMCFFWTQSILTYFDWVMIYRELITIIGTVFIFDIVCRCHINWYLGKKTLMKKNANRY